MIQDTLPYCEHFLGKNMPYGNKKTAINCRFFVQPDEKGLKTNGLEKTLILLRHRF